MYFKQYKNRNFHIARTDININYNGAFKITKVFKSYSTIVGFEINNKDLYFTSQYFSLTTSKQINSYIKESKQLYADRLREKVFKEIVKQFT